MPITVPGMAKLSMVRNSKQAAAREALPVQQVGREQAQPGGERHGDAATLRAWCSSEFQAEPVKCQPKSPSLMAKRGQEVFERGRVVGADGLDEAAEQDDAVARLTSAPPRA